MAAECSVDETFAERHMLDDDFEVIPAPGHTSGATAFLWSNGRRRCLFTGDTIYFNKDGRVAAVLAGTGTPARILAGDVGSSRGGHR